jgi:hypothetical protein
LTAKAMVRKVKAALKDCPYDVVSIGYPGPVVHRTMGSEAANVHLGSKRQVAHILRDLRHRKSNWLRSAAKDMARAMGGDWKKYRDSWGQRRFIKSTPFPINCESPTLRSEVQE